MLATCFGALHYFGKPYERWEDFASISLLALFLTLTIRRTGDLAFAIGWHAAFDWEVGRSSRPRRASLIRLSPCRSLDFECSCFGIPGFTCPSRRPGSRG